MFSMLFPKAIDNKYRGQWLALVLFLPVLLIKLMMGFNFTGLNPMVDVRQVLQDVDGVPLDAYSAEAANTLVDFASSWGLSLFTVSLVGVIALVRYRAMIPIAILLLTVEQVGRKAMGVAESGLDIGPDMSAGAIINWVLSAVLVLALILSMMRRRNAPD